MLKIATDRNPIATDRQGPLRVSDVRGARKLIFSRHPAFGTLKGPKTCDYRSQCQPIARLPIAPIADRSRDQLTDRSSQKSDRNRSQRIHTSKVMYFTVLEPRHHYEPMGKCTLGANNLVFYISDPPLEMVCRRGSS